MQINCVVPSGFCPPKAQAFKDRTLKIRFVNRCLGIAGRRVWGFQLLPTQSQNHVPLDRVKSKGSGRGLRGTYL